MYLTLCLQCLGIIINVKHKGAFINYHHGVKVSIGKIPGLLSAKNKSETGSSSSRVTLVVKLLRFLTVIHGLLLTSCFSYLLTTCARVHCKSESLGNVE